jgi:hypothetical protein
MTSFVYVATPYSKYDGGIEAAWLEACKVTADLLRRGICAYSPIAHTHPIAIYGRIDPLDHDIWLPFDAAMMDAATECYVIEMPGWHQSKGVLHEIERFKSQGKPVRHFQWPSLREVAA